MLPEHLETLFFSGPSHCFSPKQAIADRTHMTSLTAAASTTIRGLEEVLFLTLLKIAAQAGRQAHAQTDLGEAVAAAPLFVQVVLQQPLTHIFDDLDESQISAERRTGSGRRAAFQNKSVGQKPSSGSPMFQQKSLR